MTCGMVWFSSGNSVSITLRQDIADIYTKVALHCHATTTCIDDYVYYCLKLFRNGIFIGIHISFDKCWDAL